MNKVMTVAVREFLETIRTKAFIIGVVLVPGMILTFIFGVQWFGRLTEQKVLPPRRLALVDETGQLAPELEKLVAQRNQEEPTRVFELVPQAPGVSMEALAAQVRKNEYYAYLRIPADAISGSGACALGRLDQQVEAGQQINRMLTQAIHTVRFEQAEPPIDPQVVKALERDVPVANVDVQTGEVAGKEGMIARLIMPFAIMFLLYMGVMQISFGLLTSLIEEKSSRVVEVLLSALSPLQLMSGKILGMVLVGVLLLGAWGGVGYAVACARGFGGLVGGPMLLYAAMYFVPGFLLLSGMLGAIGSACNTLKEAQSMSSPITLLNIVPVLLWYPISQNPNSLLPVVLSYIPPITPFVMVLRLAADPHLPLWQIVTTQIVLWASVAVTIWAASKVFRVGVLMYGKPPSLHELLRWVRYA